AQGPGANSRWLLILLCPGRDTITCMIKPYAIIFLAFSLLAACTSATPTADPDGPRLTGFDSLPKAMATVGPLPSPNATQVQVTLESQLPTNTLPPPTYTPSPTANVGIFMGAVTVSSDNLFPTGTRAPLIITTTPQSG